MSGTATERPIVDWKSIAHNRQVWAAPRSAVHTRQHSGVSHSCVACACNFLLAGSSNIPVKKIPKRRAHRGKCRLKQLCILRDSACSMELLSPRVLHGVADLGESGMVACFFIAWYPAITFLNVRARFLIRRSP